MNTAKKNVCDIEVEKMGENVNKLQGMEGD